MSHIFFVALQSARVLLVGNSHGRKWIHKQRQKTEVEFFVPLLEYPLQPIEKYRNHPNDTPLRPYYERISRPRDE